MGAGTLDAMGGRFDITRVSLRNYRGLGQCDVALGPLTVLVGPNGSGKSNFVDSLRFMSQALDESLDNALRERGGIDEVRRRSTGHPRHLSVKVWFRGRDFAGAYEFEIGAVRGKDYRVTREECTVKHASFGVPDAHYRVRAGVLEASSVSAVLPAPADDRLYLVLASALPEFRPVFEGLSAIDVYNLNPGLMRQPQRPDAGDLLRRDGSNIASVLEHLRRTAPDAKPLIEEYLSRIVPGVVSADRRDLGAYETIEFRQDVAGAAAPWSFPATSMSDGTLRALGILVALFAPGANGYSPIGIEEPETALHPAAAGTLLEAIESASRRRQVIVTSHSPEMLDSPTLKPESLLAVRADAGVTRVAPLDEAAADALRTSLFTAGELLRVDQLQPSDVDQPELDLFT
jgi:predicted ATPase